MEERITSKENPTVKLYRKLSKNRKDRRENGMFVAEGLRICTDAVNHGFVNVLMVTETAENKYPEFLDYFDGNILRISDAVGELLSDTGTTQGVFAICKIPENPSLDSFSDKSGKYLVLNGLQDPVNIGTIIRTADAVGMDGVIMCSCCDLYNPKVIRGTMGSVFRVKTAICGYETAVEHFKSIGVITYAAVIDTDAVSLTECDFSGGSAVVIGNEGNGLTDADAMMCDKKLTIKMHGNIDSLNAAMAAGIIIWEMKR